MALPLITEPTFYAVAVPAVLLLGLSKAGFGAGFGSLAVPMMALVVSVPQAAAILMPVLLLMDLMGVTVFRREVDWPLLRFLIPFGLLGTGTARHMRRLRKQLTSRLIHRCITHTQLVARPDTPGYPLELVRDEQVAREVAILMGVEFVLMIRHPRVTTHEHKGKLVVSRLFEAHAQEDSGDLFPEDVREVWEEVRHDEGARLRHVCDYVAGMTDAYALKLYARLFDPAASQYQPW